MTTLDRLLGFALLGLSFAAPACDSNNSNADDDDALAPIVPCDPAPGRICTLAGTGEAGLGGEGLDPRQTELYLPQDYTVGPDKLGYIVDWNNHRIRRINADGTTESVVGTGELGDAQDGEGAYSNLNHPTHMVIAPNGKFIIAAWHNSKLMEFDPETSELVTICGNGMRSFGGDGGPASMALLDLPTSTAFDSFGNMYITDQANQRIRVVDTDGMIDTYVGNGMPGFSGDGEAANLAQIKLPGGQSAPPAGRIAVDKLDNLYIADSANNRIRKVDPDGVISTIAGTGDPTFGGDGGPATAASLSRPSDVEVDRDGNLYIADTDNSCVRKIDAEGIISTIAGKCGQPGYAGDGADAKDALLDRPYGVALDDAGNVYVSDTHNHRIRVIYK